MGKKREYWPIVEKVEIFIPNCDILQGGLVLVDIPGFRDPNPVRKRIAKKVRYFHFMSSFFKKIVC